MRSARTSTPYPASSPREGSSEAYTAPAGLARAPRPTVRQTAASPKHAQTDDLPQNRTDAGKAARHTPLPYFLAGIACALAASNNLAGAAELGGFLTWPSMVVGYALGMAAIAGGMFVKAHTRIGYTHLSIAAMGILVLTYAVMGLVMGDAKTVGDFAKNLQHHAIISMELAVCAFAWLTVVDEARFRGTKQEARIAAGGLAAVNLGKAAGALVGIFSPLDPPTLSIIALVAFVPALFFLAAALFGGRVFAAPDKPPIPGEANAASTPLVFRYRKRMRGMRPHAARTRGPCSVGRRASP